MRRPSSRKTLPAHLLVLTLVAVALAGCGTTVQLGPAGAAGGAPTSEFGVPTPAVTSPSGSGSQGAGGPGGTPGLSAIGTNPAGEPGSGAKPTSAPSTSLSAHGATGATGHGVTDSTVEIGVAVSSDEGSFISSFGLKGLTPDGDTNVQMQAIVNDINRHGGLAGRKIVLVKHDYPAAQTISDPSTANQAACATWTQDHHVFAVVGPPLVNDTLLQCLAKADTPLIYNGGGLEYPLHYQGTYDRFPTFFNVGSMLGDRYDAIAIRRLYQRGFFSPWNTVRGAPGLGATQMRLGIVAYDDNDGAIQLASETRQLARYGIKPTEIVKCPRDIAGKVPCEQGAVLRFNSNRVTNVFNADTTFMSTANNQGYHPRYFVEVEPGIFSQNVSKGVLRGAMGEDYVPALDVAPRGHPADPSPATTHCKNVMKAVHQPTTMGVTVWNEEVMCDGFYFLAAAVKANPVLNTEGLVAGFNSLRDFPSALTWKSELSPTNHASAMALRDLSYGTACNCWTYDNTKNQTE
ncbi:MAG TPA: ABC transporter substrate-binding protein [Mycobacteriales bacterium]|nr:ABC transporter substrate-binding protein [Mycobacteriales bacterium]